MPRNGSGSYGLPSGNPVVTGTVISSTDFNNTMTDLGTALSGSLASDGQTAWAGNQNANGNRLTSLPLPAASTDAGTAGDMQTGRLTYLTGVAGTNAITASVALLASLTVGESFRFIAAGSNTGAVTLNINGLGAKSVVGPDLAPLVGGEIAVGAAVTVMWDGASFLIPGVSLGRLIGVQVISATQTYTPTSGTRRVRVLLVGGGGAGGGAAATGAGQVSAGAGGSGGGWAESFLTTGFAGVTVTIGAGGAGVSGGTGGNGGTTSFGAVFSATGGVGAAAGAAASAATANFSFGTVGGAGSGGNVLNAVGHPGGVALYLNGQALGGAGGASYFGAGGFYILNPSNGVNASARGSGGGGAAQGASGGALTGGGGVGGSCIVWEYA